MKRSLWSKFNILKSDIGKLFLELLVVFLGVTSSFILYNWKINQEEKELEQKYLNGFYQDVSETVKDLEETLRGDSLWKEQAKPMLEIFTSGEMNIDSAIKVIQLIYRASKFDSYRSTYDDIINSGNLNIISDYNVRVQIVDYYNFSEGIEYIDGYFNNYFTDYVMTFTYEEFDALRGTFINNNIINSVRFANVFLGYYEMVNIRSNYYKELYNKSKNLKDNLTKFL